MDSFNPLTVVFFVLTLVPAIVLHELAHGVVADRSGDTTPRLMGRLTVNPIKHVDPFGTIILPGLLLLPYLFGRGGVVFGYAKPMLPDPLTGFTSEKTSVLKHHGPCLVVAPFNFQFAIAGGPAAAALEAGNTLVFK